MPGCREAAEHRAPKDRGLGTHYTFCLEHVREYNKAWNFFEGMSPHEVEEHMHKSLYGDRPTWAYGVNGDAEEALYRKAWQTHNFTDKEPPPSGRRKESARQQGFGERKDAPEHEALAIMGLEPPVVLAEIKTRYKMLAKKHHPDLNGGCIKSQELLKQINMAYTILKLAYQKFEELPDRN
ncbi:MAG: J domain-containing protein [Alphaproteobacteria bacterium]|nr:J domain-containing protein [Alphaproteobacteria bacterium]